MLVAELVRSIIQLRQEVRWNVLIELREELFAQVGLFSDQLVYWLERLVKKVVERDSSPALGHDARVCFEEKSRLL